MNAYETIKKVSEKKHQKIYKYLVRELPGCEVKYNGLEGHDIYINSLGRTVWVEIKTCDKIVCNGIDHNKMRESSRPEIFNIHRLGRLKFDRRNLYPYNVSQHDDLVNVDGWYLFFVGTNLGMHQILFGIKAKDVKLNPKKGLQQLVWSKLAAQSHPDWFEHLTKELGEERQKLKNKYCDRCGKSLGLVYPNTKYCDKCRRERHAEQNRAYLKRACKNCGKPCYGTLCRECFMKHNL